MMIFEYGAVRSKYSCDAENKLTAYATMCAHYGASNHMIVVYSPDECAENDQWFNLIDGKVSARLDEIFGGEGSFDKYFEDHIEEIKACLKSIKRLV